MVWDCDLKPPVVRVGLWSPKNHSLHHHSELAVNALLPWESGAVVHDPSYLGALCAYSNFLIGGHAVESIGESNDGRYDPAHVALPVVSFHEEGVLDCVHHRVQP